MFLFLGIITGFVVGVRVMVLAREKEDHELYLNSKQKAKGNNPT